jgi:hypothetical protein
MTMFGHSWGLNLVGVTPVAKLIAIYIGDSCNQDAQGRASISDLASWCGVKPRLVLGALAVLERRCGVIWRLVDADAVEYQLPGDALPPKRDRNQQRHEGKLTLYVMTGRHGVKVGITTNLQERVYSLRNAMLDDTVTAKWSATAPTSIVRRAEMRAHASLKAKLIRNEWFTASVDEAIAAASEALRRMLAERNDAPR